MAAILSSIERHCEFKTPVVWRNVFIFGIGHILGLYGFTLLPTAKIASMIWMFLCAEAALSAVSIGVHRLWTHRSYQLKIPARFIVMLCYVLSGQYSIMTWARDHRTHHKFTDTDADPHSSARGLFYSHCGWLLMKRHSDVKDKGKVIDVSELWQDPVIRFHQKYFIPLFIVIHVIFPSAVAYYVFGETFKNAVFILYFGRYVATLHIIWLINSSAHYWGDKPYNKKISAANHSIVALVTVGEGWHNFHHTFPWDYRIGEYGMPFRFGAYLIDALAYIGQATHLKLASPELIQKVIAKQDLPQHFEVPDTGLLDN